MKFATNIHVPLKMNYDNVIDDVNLSDASKTNNIPIMLSCTLHLVQIKKC